MNEFPTEILLKIFGFVPGTALYRCRRVCRRWNEIIDDINEIEWKIFCERDHRFIHKAYEKARLTYKQLHKSMCLWPKIDDASVTSTLIYGKSFRLLANGILAVCIIDKLSCRHCQPRDECGEHCDRANTVVYYDVNSLKEIRRRTYHVLFRPDKYEENENLVLLRGYERNEVIEVKNKCMLLLDNRDIRDGINFYLNDTKVMVAGRSTLTVLTVKETRYNTRVYSLDPLWGDIITVNCYEKNLYVITGNYCKSGQIRCLQNGQFVFMVAIDRFMPYIFEYFGFDWTRPDLYEWLINAYKDQLEIVTKYMIHAACRFGTTTLFVTRLHRAKFFLSSSKFRTNRLHFNRSIPIEFRQIPNLQDTHIENIDAVEIEDGHKVFLLLADRKTIVAFEFTHKLTGSQSMTLLETSTSESGTKRPKDLSPIEPGASTSGIETKKAKDETQVESAQSTSDLQTKTSDGQSLTEPEPSGSWLQIAKDQTMMELPQSTIGLETKKTEDQAQSEPEQSSSKFQIAKDETMMELPQSTIDLETNMPDQPQSEPEKSSSGLETMPEHQSELESLQSSSGLETKMPKEQSPTESKLSSTSMQTVNDQSELKAVPSITGIDLKWPKGEPEPGPSINEIEKKKSETLI